MERPSENDKPNENFNATSDALKTLQAIVSASFEPALAFQGNLIVAANTSLEDMRGYCAQAPTATNPEDTHKDCLQGRPQ